MLHNPFSTPMPTSSARPTLQLSGLQTFQRSNSSYETFSDSRTHGYQGPSRSVTIHNVCSAGGSAISKSPDGERCVVVGKDSLRILRVSDGTERPASEHKYATGSGGFRIDASKNFWTGSSLKFDSAMTDVAWCHKAFDTKILTSARNGEIHLWDIQKSGSVRYESKKKAHARSINKLSYSSVMPHFCSTGSSDGWLRVWDLRNLQKESAYVNHPFALRTLLFSPSILEPFHAIAGLDNGSMCRWDLRSGQKGLLEMLPLAHAGAILSFDWCESGAGGGWLASAGLDRTVKVWDFNDRQIHSSRKPAYTMHTSYPVRRVIWRPGYETELAIASYNESAYNPTSKTTSSSSVNAPPILSSLSKNAVADQNSLSRTTRADIAQLGAGGSETRRSGEVDITQRSGDMIEIWDVRRPWIAKWIVDGSNCEGGVSDITFADSHALWVQHPSGAFSQTDLRFCDKPMDSIARGALSWAPTGSLTFVSDNVGQWEVPYDDIPPRSSSDSPEKVEMHKRLGDKLYTPTSQTVGTIFDVTDSEDWDVFNYLARSYKIEGTDQSTLCELNAEVAFEAGNSEAGRIWLLLRSLLADAVASKTLPSSLCHKDSVPTLPHPTSAPAGVPTVKRSPAKASENRASSSDPPSLIRQVTEKRSGALTPVSVVLTPSTRSPASPVLTQSIAGRKNGKQADSGDERSKARRKSMNVGMVNRSRRLSLRRNSSSAAHVESRQLASRNRMAHKIGEGALDDSDSSNEGNEPATSAGRRSETVSARTSRGSIRSSAGGSTKSSQTAARIVSSPGLHEDNEWAEDEREDSVSPASSSEFESDNSVASTTAARASSLRRHTRSRSSTLATLAATSIPASQNRDELQRTDSHSSVLTVTAGGDKSVPQELPMQPESFADSISLAPSHKSRKSRSQALSTSNVHTTSINVNNPFTDEGEMRFLEWNHLAIKESEDLYRQTAWNALREVLERLAENGNVQMCAMLACIAPSELGITTWRAFQFLEGYIDILSRFRMHEVLAYIRKYAPSAEVRQSTQLQTTVYSACATCRKPLLHPSSARSEGVQRERKGFSQCFECKRAAIMCTLCHLPVRSALFVCIGCSHGGHRTCYERYYTRRPPVELSASAVEPRGRRLRAGPASEGGGSDPSSLGGDVSLPEKPTVLVMGQPCAAGCGHFCWEKVFST